MKRVYLGCIALLLAIALLLGGCRQNSKQSADRFVGLNVVLDVEPGQVGRTERHEPDGELLILPLRYDEQSGDPVVGSEIGNCFTNIHQSVHATDEGSTYSLSARLYVYSDQLPSNAILRAESVYQRPDGSLYADDSGCNYSGMLAGLLIDLSEGDTSVHLEIAEGVPMVSAEIIEMDENNAEIHRQPLQRLDWLLLSDAADWALLVEELADGTVRRTAINPPFEDAYVEVLFSGSNGICLPMSYSVFTQKTIEVSDINFDGIG